MTVAVCAIFFLSGAAALVFETLWFRQASLALGSSVWAGTIVLASFMGGLGLGNWLAARSADRARNPLLLYAGLEGLVAASGLVVALGLPELGTLLAPALRPLLDQTALLNGVRLAVAFAALLAPATAMGATLPVLTHALAAREPRFATVLGRLYGWNTAGAVVGALAGELWLIRLLGITGTAACAAGAALVAAGGASLTAARMGRGGAGAAAAAHAAPPARPLDRRSLLLLASALFCGACVLALEVLWFRFLTLFAMGTAIAFAVMLASVLVGIAAGGLVAAWASGRRQDLDRALPALAFGAGLLTVLCYALFDADLGGRRSPYFMRPIAIALASLPLVLPVCVLSGMIFTLQGAALQRAIGGESRPAGLLALWNTAGGIAGSVLGGFLLLPVLGIEGGVFAVALAYAGAGVLLLAARAELPLGWARSAAAGAAVALLIALVAFPFGAMQSRFLPTSGGVWLRLDRGTLVATREGTDATHRLIQADFLGMPLHHRLLTNGYSMSGTLIGPRRYMKMFVYLPSALHPKLESALLIGFGVGQTARALADTRSLARIDVVDLSREILGLSSLVFSERGTNPLEDPRVHVHVEDGRFYLQTTDRRYDLITGEPPPPKAAGVVNLYTREYFELLRERLNEGGVVSYWLPGHSLTARDARTIMRAFIDVFPDATLWWGWGLDFVMLGSRGLATRPSMEQFSRPWRDPVVGADLVGLGIESPEVMSSLYIADAPTLARMIGPVEPLVDGFPQRMSPEVVLPAHTFGDLMNWLDEGRSRASFEASEWIRQTWPEELRRAVPSWFDHRARVRGWVFSADESLAPPERIHNELEAKPPSSALPLWLMASNDRMQQLASRAAAQGRSEPEIDFHLGARAMAERRFAAAAEHFRRAGERDGDGRFAHAVLYQAYALCLAGDRAGASALLAGHAPDAGPAVSWRWLEKRFELGEGTP